MSTITATRLAVNKNKRKLGTPIEATTEEDFTMVKLAHCYQDSSTNALSRNGQRYPITPLTLQPRQPECAGDPPQAGSPNYVNVKDVLGAAFSARLCWTNDPTELLLSIYFRPNPPNLATSYGIPGLRPILKHPSDDKFLLADNSGNFYIWVSYEGGLYLMNDHPDLREAIAEAIDEPLEEDLTEIFESA